MTTLLSHIALVVHDLRAAEDYYRQLFDMTVIGREAPLSDGMWYALPVDKGWDDALGAGVDLAMVALRVDDFVLALFQGEAVPGQVFAIGLRMPTTEIARLRDRLPAGAVILEDRPDGLGFLDRYRINWQVSVPEYEFRSSGDIAGRWIPL
jgi:catechol 2,3-dioxygenase-like lactoylglutathione lyase family enzyme